MTRDHDIALYGATGFTGKLVAAWLANEHPDVRVVLVGRNRAKLVAVQASLPTAPPVALADSGDPASLLAVASSCRVLITTVGPYIKHGLPVVRAAVEGGCDYVDITGEPDFVNASRAELHEKAAEKGLKIVHCCGFDSLPHDVGAWLASRALPADTAQTVSAYVSAKGYMSGGTWNSALESIGNLRPASRGRRTHGHDARIEASLHHSAEAGGYGVPLPTIDPVIVVRSARALGYGSSFRYGHYLRVKKKRMLVAGGLAVGAVVLAARAPALRRWLGNRLPSGSGPNQAQREAGWFKVVFLGEGGGQSTKVVVRGDLDPGYGMTARWSATCALTLLQDRESLPAATGVVTSVVGLGQPLLDRLPATGTVIECSPSW